MEGGFLPEEPKSSKQATPFYKQSTSLPSSSSRPPPTAQPRPAPPPPSHAALAHGTDGGCSRCNSISFSQQWLTAFGVVLCNECQRDERLISKSSAKTQYSLTDGDLKKLGSIRRANPHKKDWQPMQLFMQSQVEALCYEKYGGPEGLEEYQRNMLDQKLQARLRRRKDDKEKEAKEVERLDRVKRRILEESSKPVVDVNISTVDVECEDI